MGIVIGKVETEGSAVSQTAQGAALPPPVPGAVALTPMQMNLLHFGSPRNTPLRK